MKRDLLPNTTNIPHAQATTHVERVEAKGKKKKTGAELSVVRQDDKPLFIQPVYRAKKHEFF
jgi:hypothetical protein